MDIRTMTLFMVTMYTIAYVDGNYNRDLFEAEGCLPLYVRDQRQSDE